MRGKLTRPLQASHTTPQPTPINWCARSACKDQDPDLFFPEGDAGLALLQTREAQSVCAQCPVRQQCLNWALETDQEFGVWGGTSAAERRSIKRRSTFTAQAA